MDVTFQDNEEASRFEALRGGEVVGFADYRLEPGRIEILHTEVDDSLEGKGVGSGLVRFALERAQEGERSVVPWCPFVRAWLRRHPEFIERVSFRHREQFGL